MFVQLAPAAGPFFLRVSCILHGAWLQVSSDSCVMHCQFASRSSVAQCDLRILVTADNTTFQILRLWYPSQLSSHTINNAQHSAVHTGFAGISATAAAKALSHTLSFGIILAALTNLAQYTAWKSADRRWDSDLAQYTVWKSADHGLDLSCAKVDYQSCTSL